MDESKRQHMITKVAEALRRGDNTEEVFEAYLYRCMFLYRNPDPVTYWSTYREKLPDRIEDVKGLIDKYRTSANESKTQDNSRYRL